MVGGSEGEFNRLVLVLPSDGCVTVSSIIYTC